MISGKLENPVPISPRWGIILIVFAVAVSFRDAPFLGFVDYDDPLLFQTEAIRGGLSTHGIRYAFTEMHNNLWHPLTILSHQLDFQINGNWAGGHHLTSVLIHAASCILLFSWLSRFSKKFGLALVVTLLFAIHPMRVESVVWISERKDVLATFFYLLAIWFYSVWATRESSTKSSFYWFSIVATLLAVLSKPSIFTLPLVLILIDFWPLKSAGSFWRRLIQKTPFFLLAVAAILPSWLSISKNQFVGGKSDVGLWQQTATSIFAMGTYLRRTFWPNDLAPFESSPAELSTTTNLIGIAVLSAITAIAIVCFRRKNRAVPIGWGWFLVVILPVSGLITISDNFAPDRYIYIAQIGFLIALAWGAHSVFSRWKIPPIVPGIVVLLIVSALSVATARQVRVWKNPETLWTHTLAVTEQNHVAHHQLGLHFIATGRTQEGIVELREAVATDPGNPVPEANLALALVRIGKFDEGVSLFSQTHPALPQRTRFRDEMTSALLAANQNDLAVRLHRSFVIPQSKPESLIALGNLHYHLGDDAAALSAYREATEFAPEDKEAAQNYGSMLLKTGNPAAAIPFLETAQSPRTLAQVYLLLGKFTESLANYNAALESDPRNSLIINELAQLLLDCPDESMRDPARALVLATQLNDDNNPRFLRTLTRGYLANNQPENAQKAADQGLKLIVELQKNDPLEKPWTQKELSELTAWFSAVIDR